MEDIPMPNIEQSKSYSKAFGYLSLRLFGGELPIPMLVLNRNSQIVGGYFAPNRWHNEDGINLHEMSLNANVMNDDVLALMGCLIHEMVHLWQQEFGDPGRSGYHNKEFAEKCKLIGLIPKSVDGSGKETGDAVTTELKPGGKAEKAIAEMPEDTILPWMSIADPTPDPGNPGNPGAPEKGRGSPSPKPRGNSGKRAKYTCPICGLNAWARAGVRLLCGDCDRILIEQKKEG